VGSAVETMVWSSAESSIANMTATMIMPRFPTPPAATDCVARCILNTPYLFETLTALGALAVVRWGYSDSPACVSASASIAARVSCWSLLSRLSTSLTNREMPSRRVRTTVSLFSVKTRSFSPVARLSSPRAANGTTTCPRSPIVVVPCKVYSGRPIEPLSCIETFLPALVLCSHKIRKHHRHEEECQNERRRQPANEDRCDADPQLSTWDKPKRQRD